MFWSRKAGLTMSRAPTVPIAVAVHRKGVMRLVQNKRRKHCDVSCLENQEIAVAVGKRQPGKEYIRYPKV